MDWIFIIYVVILKLKVLVSNWKCFLSAPSPFWLIVCCAHNKSEWWWSRLKIAKNHNCRSKTGFTGSIIIHGQGGNFKSFILEIEWKSCLCLLNVLRSCLLHDVDKCLEEWGRTFQFQCGNIRKLEQITVLLKYYMSTEMWVRAVSDH